MIHDVLVDDVHVQPVCVVTVTVPAPPGAVGVTESGLTTKVQAAGSVTVKFLPAIVSVAERVDALVFAAALNLTVPLPVPLDPLTTVAHPAPLVAVHPQPAVVVTATVPEPPAAANA